MGCIRIIVIASGAAFALACSATAGAAAQVDPSAIVARHAQSVPRPLIRVPPLPADATLSTASDILRQAGFTAGRILCDRSSGQPGTIPGQVTSFAPASGAMAPLGSRVDMV